MIIDCKSHQLNLNFNIWFHIVLNVLVCIALLNDTLYPYILSNSMLLNFIMFITRTSGNTKLFNIVKTFGLY
jgi:hypothetical protein